MEGQWGGEGGGAARALETLQTLVAMERGQTGWTRGSLIKYHTTHHGTRSLASNVTRTPGTLKSLNEMDFERDRRLVPPEMGGETSGNRGRR